MLKFNPTQTQICPPKQNFEPTQTPSKNPNFKPVLPETGQTKAKIWKNRTSNPSKTQVRLPKPNYALTWLPVRRNDIY